MEEDAQNEGGGGVHHVDGGARHADEDVHRPGDSEGDAFGAGEGEGLGDKLAEQDLKVEDRGKGEDRGCGVRVEQGVRGRLREPAVLKIEQHLRDGGLAQPAEGERGQGDAELHGGKKLVDIALEGESGARAGAVERDELLHARDADGDNGELRGHEEAVGQDEEGHHQHAEED